MLPERVVHAPPRHTRTRSYSYFSPPNFPPRILRIVEAPHRTHATQQLHRTHATKKIDRVYNHHSNCTAHTPQHLPRRHTETSPLTRHNSCTTNKPEFKILRSSCRFIMAIFQIFPKSTRTTFFFSDSRFSIEIEDRGSRSRSPIF